MRKLKTGGRRAGTPNRTTLQIRDSFELLIQGNISALKADLKSLKPIDRLKMIIELSKFVVPTLKAVAVNDGSEETITIDFTEETSPDLKLLSTDELIERANAIRQITN